MKRQRTCPKLGFGSPPPPITLYRARPESSVPLYNRVRSRKQNGTQMSLGAQRHNLPRISVDNAVDLIGPQRQRGLHLLGVGSAIVNARNATLVTADVVQYRFHDMRLDSKFSHACRCCSTQVVDRPACDAEAFNESLLLRPTGEAARPFAEEEIATVALLGLLEDLKRQRGKR